jgi:phage shock protein A
MSILGRIRDILSANINSLLDTAEDPQKMADANKLNRLEAQYLAETDSWDTKAAAALRASDEKLAKAALSRKVQANKLYQEYKSQSDAQEVQVEQLQNALVQLQTRIAETRAKRDLIVAKKNRAETQEAIQRTVRGIGSSTSALDKLDQLEQKVDERLDKAEAMAKLEGDTLDKQFADLEKETEVDAELAELKRRMGQG